MLTVTRPRYRTEQERYTQAASPSEGFPPLAEMLLEIGVIVAMLLGLAVAFSIALLASA